MSDLISFDFEQGAVRAAMVGDSPWFVANDVAQVLDYSHAPHMVRQLDDDEKGVHIVDTLGGPQTLTIISESGLFAVILKSRKPESRRFRRWVTGEVLPALRRHGRYAMPTAPTPIEGASLAAAIAAVREARRLFGQQSARTVWMKLGLPAPIVDTTAELANDPLTGALESYLRTVGETTIDDAAAALGLRNFDDSTRYRIGQLLRLFGWFPRKQRVRGKPVNLFTPRAVQEA